MRAWRFAIVKLPVISRYKQEVSGSTVAIVKLTSVDSKIARSKFHPAISISTCKIFRRNVSLRNSQVYMNTINRNNF